jgi:hypothetical protein
MTIIDLRLTPSRRERLESIMAGCISSSSIGSASCEGQHRVAGTTSVGFVRKRLELDEDASDSQKRLCRAPRPSPDPKISNSIADCFQPESRTDHDRPSDIEKFKVEERIKEKPISSQEKPSKLSGSLFRSNSNVESSSELEKLQNELSKAHSELNDYKSRSTGVIMQLLRQLSSVEARERQEQLSK